MLLRNQPPGETSASQSGDDTKIVGKRKIRIANRALVPEQNRAETEEEKIGSPVEKSSEEPELSWKTESAETLRHRVDGAPDCCRYCGG